VSTLREKWHAGLNVRKTSGGLSPLGALLRFHRCFRGYDPAATRAYLERLAREGVRMTLFLTGSFVGEHADWALKMQELGCEIGLHGFRHLSPNRLSAAGFEGDLRRCIRAFREARLSFSGYRAPTLAMSLPCYPVLKRMGIAYSSSWLCADAPDEPLERCIAFMDVPFILHHPGEDAVRETLLPHLSAGKILCLHPYGLLGTRYGPITRRLLLDSGLRAVTIAEQLRGAEGLSVSVDFGA